MRNAVSSTRTTNQKGLRIPSARWSLTSCNTPVTCSHLLLPVIVGANRHPPHTMAQRSSSRWKRKATEQAGSKDKFKVS